MPRANREKGYRVWRCAGCGSTKAEHFNKESKDLCIACSPIDTSLIVLNHGPRNNYKCAASPKHENFARDSFTTCLACLIVKEGTYGEVNIAIPETKEAKQETLPPVPKKAVPIRKKKIIIRE